MSSARILKALKEVKVEIQKEMQVLEAVGIEDSSGNVINPATKEMQQEIKNFLSNVLDVTLSSRASESTLNTVAARLYDSTESKSIATLCREIRDKTNNLDVALSSRASESTLSAVRDNSEGIYTRVTTIYLHQSGNYPTLTLPKGATKIWEDTHTYEVTSTSWANVTGFYWTPPPPVALMTIVIKGYVANSGDTLHVRVVYWDDLHNTVVELVNVKINTTSEQEVYGIGTFDRNVCPIYPGSIPKVKVEAYIEGTGPGYVTGVEVYLCPWSVENVAMGYDYSGGHGVHVKPIRITDDGRVVTSSQIDKRYNTFVTLLDVSSPAANTDYTSDSFDASSYDSVTVFIYADQAVTVSVEMSHDGGSTWYPLAGYEITTDFKPGKWNSIPVPLRVPLIRAKVTTGDTAPTRIIVFCSAGA